MRRRLPLVLLCLCIVALLACKLKRSGAPADGAASSSGLQTATVWLVSAALSGPVTVLDGKGDEKGRGDMKLGIDQTFN